MDEAIPPLVLTTVLLLIAWKGLLFAAPLLVIAAVWWLVTQTDRIINYFFPLLEWEKSLGWLNIRAERRANAALRWVGYAIYAVLVFALSGIVWAAFGLQNLANWSDPWVMGDLALRVPVLGICLGVWLLYLGGWLIPKLRAEREEAGLRQFRREMAWVELEREMHPRSRVKSPLRKPRASTPDEDFSLGAERMKWRG